MFFGNCGKNDSQTGVVAKAYSNCSIRFLCNESLFQMMVRIPVPHIYLKKINAIYGFG